MKKRIVLCADDYGQGQEISQAILSLLEKEHLSATSCLVTSPSWPEAAKWLAPFKNKADLGLHFNLTEGKPLTAALGETFRPLPHLLRHAFTSRLNNLAIANELAAQLDRFVEHMGCLPDFIDGHQHVHQFPQIRSSLMAIYKKRQLQGYLRQVNPYLWSGGVTNIRKKMIISMTGVGFARQVKAAGIDCNRSFSGIYDFSQAERYPALFRQFLQETTDKGLIMCHPAFENSPDCIGQARTLEYAYLRSSAFRADCEALQVVIGRGSGTFNV